MAPIRFTIFTPTFNRRDLIARVYQSLCGQTFSGFEWLVVDDGSTDDTAARIAHWQQSAAFPIRYVSRPHQGKHRAYNHAIAQAQGEFLAVLDSDDAIVPDALERLLFHWNSIPEQDRGRYSGVTCLCLDEGSKVVGRPFPTDVLDCRHYETQTRFGAGGEKWGFHRTAVLRDFPFPEFPREDYCPEGVVWNRIAKQYLVRHVNEPLRIYYTQPGGITDRIHRILMRNPRYARLFYQESMQLDVPLWWKAKWGINYTRYSLHAGVSLIQTVADSAGPVLTGALLFAGCAFYAADRLRLRQGGAA